ncbi:MAG TPA: cytochrome c biogenesis heme-transporting ATPase CcmA [Burkholderiales bacterium]|nr:cytochrome c biogenesis heme-transporting ATPase CcmA [Burkholderiales bacterium]
MLEAIDLECVRGERRVFSGLSFSLGAGEILQLFGANGSGKTSLLRIIAGLVPPASGQVRWRGEPISTLGEDYHQELLYLAHANGIKDDLTAIENLRVAATLAGKKIDRATAFDALERVGLGGREDLPARALSHGQRRRVALARTLVSEASLWVLDEPLTSLDREAAAEIEAIIESHLARGGAALIATHQELKMSGATSMRLQLNG